jgi:hypothetical protein
MSALPPQADVASSVFMSTRPSSMQAAVDLRFGRRAKRKPELIMNLGYDRTNNLEFGITWA